MERYKLQKVVISMGLGNRSRLDIEKVKTHFTSIITTALEKPVKPQVTTCKKSNAKFKIRKGAPCGIRLTLRKQIMGLFLKTMAQKTDLRSELKYNSSTLFYGVKDHRSLRLQKYNYEAPSYGFNIALVFNDLSSRTQNRRLCPQEKKNIIPQKNCRKLVECI